MRATVIQTERGLSVCLSVCLFVCGSVGLTICQPVSVGLSVTIVSPAKTAEPIEIRFRLWTWVGPRN